MRKRLIAAEQIRAGEALTCVETVAGPGPGDFDFRIGVLRPGATNYYPGPLGFARRDFAPGDVLRDDVLPEVKLEPLGPAEPWSTGRPTPLADILALRERFRGR